MPAASPGVCVCPCCAEVHLPQFPALENYRCVGFGAEWRGHTARRPDVYARPLALPTAGQKRPAPRRSSGQLVFLSFFSFFLGNLFLVLPFLCFARTVLAVFLVRGWTGFAVALDRRRRRRWTGSPTGKIASGSNVRRAAVSATALCVQRGQSFHSYSSFADQRACLFEGIAR